MEEEIRPFLVTAQQMKTIEQNACALGMTMLSLMENAGKAAAEEILSDAGENGGRITIFCGSGNNGGDGFVAARHLYHAGKAVAVVMCDGEPRTGQAAAMLGELRAIGEVPILQYGEDLEEFTALLAGTAILVDAIYGTGFHGTLDERHRDICRLMNGLKTPLISLDIPSGVAADTGAADSCCVRASVTVAFDSLKPAHAMPAAAEYCGRVVCVDIGVPEEARRGITPVCLRVDESFVRDTLPGRNRRSHKGTYGRLLVVAGSAAYTGAAALAVTAALRSGAGYVTLAAPRQVCRAVFPLAPEAVMLPLPETEDGALCFEGMAEILKMAQKSTAILAGNGMGTGEDACRIIYELIKQAACPLILDADGINAVSRSIDILKQAKGPVVLTPHIGELSRLTTLPAAQLETDAIAPGQAFAMGYGVTVVLKDAYTVTAAPDGRIFFNTTGDAGMAKAGSGDLLAGIIGALAAQGRAPELAAACGVWIHGRAGECAADRFSRYGMLPRDMVGELCRVFLELGL